MSDTTQAATRPLLVGLDDALIALGGIGRSTLYRLMDSGQIRNVKVAGRRMIPTAALDEYVNSLQAA